MDGGFEIDKMRKRPRSGEKRHERQKKSIDQESSALPTEEEISSCPYVNLERMLDRITVSKDRLRLSPNAMRALCDRILSAEREETSRLQHGHGVESTNIHHDVHFKLYPALCATFSANPVHKTEKASDKQEFVRDDFYAKAITAFDDASWKHPQDSDIVTMFYKSVIPGIDPERLFEENLKKYTQRRDENNERVATKENALSLHRRERAEYFRLSSWQDALRSFVSTKAPPDVAQVFADRIAENMRGDSRSLQKMTNTMRTFTALGYETSRSFEHYSEEKKAEVLRRQRTMLELVSDNPAQNYLMHLIATEDLQKFQSNFPKPLEVPDLTDFASHLPFQISKDKYAILTKGDDGELMLVASRPEEYAKIASLFRQLDNARPAYEQATAEREGILAPYWGSDIANWPYDIHEVWNSSTPAEDTYHNIQQEIRRFFFENREKNPSASVYSGIPRLDRAINTRDLVLDKDNANGNQNDDALAEQVYFSELIRNQVGREFGVSLKDLSIREQFYLFEVVRGKTVGDIAPIMEFSREYGANGLRTFLVTAGDEQLRDKVFAFAKEVPEEEARKVFEAYGKLVGSIDSVGDYLRDAFGHTGEKATQEVTNRMLERGRSILAEASEHKNNLDQLNALVASTQAENALFLEAFKTIKNEGTLKLEDVVAVRSSIVPGQWVLNDKKLLDAVDGVYARNYPPERAAILLDRFHQDLSVPGARFYLISHIFEEKEIPIAFMLTAEKGESTYVSALNVEQEFSSARPGKILMDKIAEIARSGRIIEASATQDIARGYIALGCVADKIIHEDDGSIRFHVRGSRQISALLQSRDKNTYGTGRLVGMASETFDRERPIQVLRPKTADDLFSILQAPIAEGFVVTQIIPREGTILAVIEKLVGVPLRQAA